MEQGLARGCPDEPSSPRAGTGAGGVLYGAYSCLRPRKDCTPVGGLQGTSGL
jgi:hypothetical protein